MTPLTENERRALDLCKARGPQTVGLPVMITSPRALHLNSRNVHTGVARGLWRRGLVTLTRADKRGPMIMALTKAGEKL